MNVYRFWGTHPALYAISCAITFMFREEELRARAVQHLDIKAGDVVLDLACGTGRNFPYLQERVGTRGKIIGVDYSSEMLEAAEQTAREKRWNNVELRQGDAATFCLDEAVDAVLSTLGMSAVPRHQQALERAYAALHPGGRIVIMDALPFQGVLGVFNPLVKGIFGPLASWDYRKDIIGEMSRIFPNTTVEYHNGGTIYIATGTKK